MLKGQYKGLNFANGVYRTSLGKIVIIHQWLPKLRLWYGLWPKKQKVVYFDEYGLCSDDRVGKLETRRRQKEAI